MTDICKNPQISNFIIIRRVGEELLHTDGRTDMINLTVAIRNFAEVQGVLSKTQTFDLLINSCGLFS